LRERAPDDERNCARVVMTGSAMRLEDLILRSIAKRCVSKDEAIEVELRQ